MQQAEHSTVPDPTDTYEQALRHAHRDLPDLSTRQLWAELAVVRHELAVRIYRVGGSMRGATERAWLEDRARRLRAELRRRRR